MRLVIDYKKCRKAAQCSYLHSYLNAADYKEENRARFNFSRVSTVLAVQMKGIKRGKYSISEKRLVLVLVLVILGLVKRTR
jgi:hypothetical protein